MPKVILLAGGTASGKSTIAQELKELIREDRTSTLIMMDNYYRPKKENLKMFPEWNGKVDWDDPKSIDWELLNADIRKLLKNKEVVKPLWSYEINDYTPERTKIFKPADVIIIEGIFALNSNIERLGDYKIYVQAGTNARLERRIRRDKETRYKNYDEKKFRKVWSDILVPSHKKFIRPTKAYADFILDTEFIKKTIISDKLRNMLTKEI